MGVSFMSGKLIQLCISTRFGFMDPPKPERVFYALKRLRKLGALDQEDKITPLGFQMSEFPLAPHLAKILLTASSMGCSDEVLTIVSMLSVKYVFIRPSEKQKRKQKVISQPPVTGHSLVV